MRDRPHRALSARGTRRNWLTIDRRSSRRRTGRLPFTAIATGHVNERSASRHWSTHRNRRTHRNGRTQRSTHRNRRTNRHRSADRNGSTQRSTGGNRRNHRNRPRQSHRNPSHVSEWCASRAARARYGSCTSSCTTSFSTFACRRLEAFVASGFQRRGRNVWAQCQSDPAQPSPSSNYSDVESIKDRHRHRLLHSRSDIPHSVDAAEPHAIPKSRVRRPRQLSAANVDQLATPHRIVSKW